MQPLTYEEILDNIQKGRRFGSLPGVKVSGRMLERLGNPQKGMPVIHVAGTNGKGSVSAFLCSVLREAGLRTGMFTSPHLVDFEERIQVDGKMIAKEDVTRLGNRLLSEEFEITPTMFDYCLGMAMLYFREQNCSAVILETGLGGRLDSTNAVDLPVVSVITKIGYDHVEILGNTLGEIAAEKAGIIKKGTRLVVESQEPEALEVILKAAEKAKRCQVVELSELKGMVYREGVQEFSYREYKKLQMKMLGSHQYENAAAAILAAEAFLEEKGIACSEEIIRKGIANAGWQGRMEVLSESPYFLVDGAHNGNGVKALAESLGKMFPGEKFHFIMGVMADKDYERMIDELLPLALDFKTVTVEEKRALQAETLAECIRKKGVAASRMADISEAVLPEKLAAGERTVAFGSLYFVGEIEEIWKKNKK